MKNMFWVIGLFLITHQACCDKSAEQSAENTATRYGTVIRVKPEKLDEYKADRMPIGISSEADKLVV